MRVVITIDCVGDEFYRDGYFAPEREVSGVLQGLLHRLRGHEKLDQWQGLELRTLGGIPCGEIDVFASRSADDIRRFLAELDDDDDDDV